jgi:hypothetical protein
MNGSPILNWLEAQIRSVAWREPALPAVFSPDFDPVEMAFAKLKALLRVAAARTIPDLWQGIADAAASPRKNVPTISPPKDTMQAEQKLL